MSPVYFETLCRNTTKKSEICGSHFPVFYIWEDICGRKNSKDVKSIANHFQIILI